MKEYLNYLVFKSVYMFVFLFSNMKLFKKKKPQRFA